MPDVKLETQEGDVYHIPNSPTRLSSCRMGQPLFSSCRPISPFFTAKSHVSVTITVCFLLQATARSWRRSSWRKINCFLSSSLASGSKDNTSTRAAWGGGLRHAKAQMLVCTGITLLTAFLQFMSGKSVKRRLICCVQRDTSNSPNLPELSWWVLEREWCSPASLPLAMPPHRWLRPTFGSQASCIAQQAWGGGIWFLLK